LSMSYEIKLHKVIFTAFGLWFCDK
jgi:hypothetical protein